MSGRRSWRKWFILTRLVRSDRVVLKSRSSHFRVGGWTRASLLVVVTVYLCRRLSEKLLLDCCCVWCRHRINSWWMDNIRKERSQCSDRQGGIELVSYQRERATERQRRREIESQRQRETETEVEADRPWDRGRQTQRQTVIHNK